MQRDKMTYHLESGQSLFIEGKHGIIQINVYQSHTAVIADRKTDAERA